MLYSLDFWCEAGRMSKKMSQVIVACKGEDNKAQMYE